MKINEETTVSEEQVLFNKLNWENQQMILRIMRCLQPCELSCEVEEEKKIPLKINKIVHSQNYVISDSKNNSVNERLEIIRRRLYENELYMLDIANTLNEIIDYLKSKGDE